MSKIRLLKRRSLSGDAAHLVFQAECEHLAGQYLALGGESRRRYYSIASAPRADRSIDLCVDVRGDFGQYLNALEPGAEIEASPPAGKMGLLDPDNAALYFASGTGIAPVRAILQAHLAANPAADARLFFGVRHSENLFYREDFERLAERHPNFEFCPTVSGPEPAWSGRRGRAEAHLKEALGGRGDLDVYFCGHREMVEQLQRLLSAAGIPDACRSFERY